MCERSDLHQMKYLNLNNWGIIFLQLHIFPEKGNVKTFQPGTLLMSSFPGRLDPWDESCFLEVIQGYKASKLTGQ